MEEAPSPRSKTEQPAQSPRMHVVRSSIRVSRSDLEKSLENVNGLLSQVRIRSYFKDGKAAGLAFSHINPKSIFAEMDLRNGDIVQEIDGTTINSPEYILSFYDKLKSGSSISLQISRRGRERTIDNQLR
jgi:general secretion pathway protein C